MNTTFRELSVNERTVLHSLLELDFPGKTEISEQIKNCLARNIDNEGSIEFKLLNSPIKAPVKLRVPVEAEIEDNDGVKINILLHVIDGYVQELEALKYDGSEENFIEKIKEFSKLDVYCKQE